MPAWHDELFRVLQTHYRDVPLRQFVRKPRGFLDQFRSGENPNFDICKTVGRGWEIEYRWESPAAVDGCATSGVERLAVSSDSVWLMDAKRSQERGMARVSKRATFGDAANISSNWDPFVVPLLATIIFGAPGRAKVLLGPPRV